MLLMEGVEKCNDQYQDRPHDVTATETTGHKGGNGWRVVWGYGNNLFWKGKEPGQKYCTWRVVSRRINFETLLQHQSGQIFEKPPLCVEGGGRSIGAEAGEA